MGLISKTYETNDLRITLKRRPCLTQPHSLPQRHLIMPRLQVKDVNLLIKVTA